VSTQFDYTAYARDGRLGLVVDVKARTGVNGMWAREFRRNLLEYGSVASGAMFLLVTPKALYLWDANVGVDDLPTYEIDATEIFRRYFEGAEIDPNKFIDRSVFGMIVGAWLRAVARGDEIADEALRRSPLPALLNGGQVVAQAAA
jgi:hypothetical protein